jgi:hypothetical protein
MKTRSAYTIETVDERIDFYTNQLHYLTKNNATDQAIDTTEKLLNFWKNYKIRYFN